MSHVHRQGKKGLDRCFRQHMSIQLLTRFNTRACHVRCSAAANMGECSPDLLPGMSHSVRQPAGCLTEGRKREHRCCSTCMLCVLADTACLTWQSHSARQKAPLCHSLLPRCRGMLCRLGGQHQLLVFPCWHWTMHMQPWLPASCPGLPAVALTLQSMLAALAGSALTCWHCSAVPAQRRL